MDRAEPGVVTAQAPVRIDFAGGWSDVPAFAEAEGGAVTNAAITLYTRVECRVGGGKIRLHANDIGERVTFNSPAEMRYDGRLDLHKAALNMLPVPGGVEIISDSDVPAGSGLGASGSLDVVLLAALARCREDEPYGPEELAEMGFHLETAELGLLGGRQDQYAAALGGFHALTFSGPTVKARRLRVSREAAEELASRTLVAYTGHSHFSSATHERVWTAYDHGDSDVRDAIRTMRDLAAEAALTIEAGEWQSLANVLDANWAQQRRLDRTISTDTTQRIEEAARAAGAWGLKATGAGAGGCLVVLGSPEARSGIAEAVTTAGGRLLDFEFDLDGVRAS